MKLKKIFTLSILFTLIISSCQKDEIENNQFPRRFNENSHEIKPLKVFTKNGELTNKTLIEEIVKRKSEIFKSEELFTKKLSIDDNFSLNYINKNEVEVITADSIENRKIIDFNSIEYLEKNKIESYIKKWDDYNYLPNNIYKYQPIYKVEEPVHGGKLIKIKPCIYTKKYVDKVILPYIETFIFNNELAGYNMVNNELNMESISELNDNDTLITREINLILK